MYLFNIIPEIIHKKYKYMLIHIFTAARLVCAKKWKNQENPTTEDLVKKLFDIVEMDSLSEALRNNLRSFILESWRKLGSEARMKEDK
ncbi:hypothetical protein JRQ81_003077, partial [Phrynocephalus forsythii]